MRKLFLCLGLFFISSILFAKDSNLGLEGGMGFASFENTNGSILGQINGLTGGLFYSLRLNDDFSLQPEVLYVEKGGSTLNQPYSFYVNYLEVPILLKWYLVKTVLNPCVFAGPFYAANVSSAVRNGELTDLNVSDYGSTVGIEISLDNTFLSMRWDISLAHVTTDQNIQNRDFILMIGQGI